MKRSSSFIYFVCALIIAAVLMLAVVVSLIGAKLLNDDGGPLVIASPSISEEYSTTDSGSVKIPLSQI